MPRPWILAARIALLLALGACAVLAAGVRLETDITRFLPEGEDRDRLALGSLVRATGFSRGLVASIEAPPGLEGEDAARALAPVSDRLAEELRRSPRFRQVLNGTRPGSDEAFYQAYFPRRLAFLSDRPEADVPRRFAPEALDRAAADLRDQLAMPSGAAVKAVAARDPLLAFPAHLQRLAAVGAETAPRTLDRRWYSQDLRHALVTAETVAPAYDTDEQAAAIEDLQAAFARAVPGDAPSLPPADLGDAPSRRVGEDPDPRHAAGGRIPEGGDGFRLRFTGLGRFVLEGQRLVQGDILWAGTASTIAVGLVFLLFFRRIRFLPLAYLPIGLGILAGLGAVLAVRGSIHGLTLAFGATLIGVGDDYPFHWLNHHRHAFPDAASEADARDRMHRGLAAAAATTVAAFVLLLFSSYPGIREIGLFCAVGVLTCWASTVLYLPLASRWLPRALPDDGKGLDVPALLDRGRRFRGPVLAGLVVLAAVSAVAATRLTFQSDARALDTSDPATLAEDAAIRAHLPASRFPLVLLVSGADAQDALRANDALHAQLQALQDRGDVARFAGLHPFLPSADLQRRNLAALAALPDPAPAVRQALAFRGFRPEAFEGFFEALADAREGRVAPLLPEDLEGTVLADIARGFLFRDGDTTRVLTLVAPSSPDDPFLAALPDTPGLQRLNQAALVSSLFSSGQRETLWLFLVALAINSIVVLRVRRRLVPGLLTLVPTVLAVLVVMGAVSLITPFNFLHLLALLLILAMGIDYALFLVRSRVPGESAGETAVAARSVLLSSATTVLSFGSLALCRTPALQAIGSTVAAGILLVCVLTFAAALLLPREAP